MHVYMQAYAHSIHLHCTYLHTYMHTHAQTHKHTHIHVGMCTILGWLFASLGEKRLGFFMQALVLFLSVSLSHQTLVLFLSVLSVSLSRQNFVLFLSVSLSLKATLFKSGAPGPGANISVSNVWEINTGYVCTHIKHQCLETLHTSSMYVRMQEDLLFWTAR